MSKTTEQMSQAGPTTDQRKRAAQRMAIMSPTVRRLFGVDQMMRR
jgi:hypothetical protein